MPAPATLPADFFSAGRAYDTQLDTQQAAQFKAWKAKNAPNDSGEDYDLQGAFLADTAGKLPRDERGHSGDTFKKPNHPSFSIESKYSGQGPDAGGRWADENGKTVFYASQANLKGRSAEDLQWYFSEQEPNVKLVLPSSAPDTLPADFFSRSGTAGQPAPKGGDQSGGWRMLQDIHAIGEGRMPEDFGGRMVEAGKKVATGFGEGAQMIKHAIGSPAQTAAETIVNETDRSNKRLDWMSSDIRKGDYGNAALNFVKAIPLAGAVVESAMDRPLETLGQAGAAKVASKIPNAAVGAADAAVDLVNSPGGGQIAKGVAQAVAAKAISKIPVAGDYLAHDVRSKSIANIKGGLAARRAAITEKLAAVKPEDHVVAAEVPAAAVEAQPAASPGPVEVQAAAPTLAPDSILSDAAVKERLALRDAPQPEITELSPTPRSEGKLPGGSGQMTLGLSPKSFEAGAREAKMLDLARATHASGLTAEDILAAGPQELKMLADLATSMKVEQVMADQGIGRAEAIKAVKPVNKPSVTTVKLLLDELKRREAQMKPQEPAAPAKKPSGSEKLDAAEKSFEERWKSRPMGTGPHTGFGFGSKTVKPGGSR